MGDGTHYTAKSSELEYGLSQSCMSKAEIVFRYAGVCGSNQCNSGVRSSLLDHMPIHPSILLLLASKPLIA